MREEAKVSVNGHIKSCRYPGILCAFWFENILIIAVVFCRLIQFRCFFCCEVLIREWCLAPPRGSCVMIKPQKGGGLPRLMVHCSSDSPHLIRSRTSSAPLATSLPKVDCTGTGTGTGSTSLPSCSIHTDYICQLVTSLSRHWDGCSRRIVLTKQLTAIEVVVGKSHPQTQEFEVVLIKDGCIES